MKKLLLLYFSFFCLSIFSQSNIIWDTVIPSGFGFDSFANRFISVDSNGNIYVLDHNIGVNGGSKDIMLYKLSASGDILWEASYDGDAQLLDEGYDLTVDVEGNVYIHGITKTIDSGGDVVIQEFSPLTLKFSSEGQLLWDVIIPVAEWFIYTEANSITTDFDGNCYVTGSFSDTTNSDISMYVAKYDSTGALEWLVNDPVDGYELGGFHVNYFNDSLRVRGWKHKLPPNPERYIYTKIYNGAGDLQYQHEESVNSYYSPVKHIERSNGDFYYIIGANVLMFDKSGNLLWEYEEVPLDGISSFIWDLAIDDEGNAYITGANSGMFTAKLNKDGELQWKSWNNLPSQGRHIDVDLFGNTIVGCDLYSNGIFSVNLLKYDPDGNEIASLIYSNARIKDLKVYDDMSFLTYIVEIGVPPNYIVQKYDLVLSNKDKVLNNVLSVYPNPSNESIVLKLDDSKFVKGEFVIKNINGQEFIRKEAEFYGEFKVDISDLPTGIYTINFISNDANYIGKFMVIK